jgi:hypothetical protein
MRLYPAYPGNPRRYIEGESPRLWRDIQSSDAGLLLHLMSRSELLGLTGVITHPSPPVIRM